MKKKLIKINVANLDELDYSIDELYEKYKGYKISFYDDESGGGYVFTERFETDEEFEKRKTSIENVKKWNLAVKWNSYKALKTELEKEGLI